MHPDFLYYNCHEADKVMRSLTLMPSEIHTGISLSAWSEMGSHGPFKIAFRRAPWFRHFNEVHYGKFPLKNPMFADEQEWVCHSHDSIKFMLGDVMYVMFMKNAPCVLGPRTLERIRKTLRTEYATLYREDVVDDHYLKKATPT